MLVAHELTRPLSAQETLLSIGYLCDSCGPDGVYTVKTTMAATEDAWWYEHRVLDAQHHEVVMPVREDRTLLLQGQPVTEERRGAFAGEAWQKHMALCERVEKASANKASATLTSVAIPSPRWPRLLLTPLACLAVLGMAWGWYQLTRPGPAPQALASVARPSAPLLPTAAEGTMVRVGRFWIDRTEVSIHEYQNVVPTYHIPYGFTADLPVVNVTWAEAARYAQMQGKRLCTAPEWLEAFAGPVDLVRVALGRPLTAPPRAAQDPQERNQLGLVNMMGNVSEWLASRDTTAPYIGGSWYADPAPAEALLVTKTLATKNVAHRHIGFRCCRDAR